MKKYDLVLLEKPQSIGLSKEEVIKLLDFLKEGRFYPVEFDGCGSVAMGFFNETSSDILGYPFENGTFRDLIKEILCDMEKESPDCSYEIEGVSVYLTRNV